MRNAPIVATLAVALAAISACSSPHTTPEQPTSTTSPAAVSSSQPSTPAPVKPAPVVPAPVPASPAAPAGPRAGTPCSEPGVPGHYNAYTGIWEWEGNRLICVGTSGGYGQGPETQPAHPSGPQAGDACSAPGVPGEYNAYTGVWAWDGNQLECVGTSGGYGQGSETEPH